MDKYVILLNHSIITNNGKNVFTLEELDNVFEEMTGGTDMHFGDNEVVTIDELIELGDIGECVYVHNQNIDEDDEVALSIVKLSW